MRTFVRLLSLAAFVVSFVALAQGGTPPPAMPPGGLRMGPPHGPMGPGGPHGLPPGMQMPGGPPPAKLTPEDVKNVFYGIGASVGKGVGDAFGPSKEEWAELRKGIQDQLDGKELRVKPEEVQPKVRQLEGERRETKHQEAIKKNPAYRNNPTINRNVIKMLASGKTQQKATNFLRGTIGHYAAPYLRVAAKTEPNPTVRKLAGNLAKVIR